MEKTVVELFAGVGGFRKGLEQNQFITKWANQWEPSTRTQHAYEVYIAHFGEQNVSNRDINEVDKKSIPDHTLLVGGFPCQDYSVARTKAEGIQGKKGVLWWSILETLEVKRPPFVLLENVDRLIKSPTKQKGRDFGVMMRTLNDLGYSLEWRVINAADYGFPQKRRRIFMFAAHNTTEYYKTIVNVDKTDLLNRSGFFIKEFPIESSYESSKKATTTNISKNIYKDLVSVSDNFTSIFHNAGVMVNGDILSIDVKAIEVQGQTLRDVLEPNPSPELIIEKESNKYNRLKEMKGAKSEPRVDKNGFEYKYSEGGMSFPDKIDKPARTLLTAETSTNRSTHVIEDPHTHQLRLLSPVECEKLNGFPPNWTNPDNTRIPIPNKRRYFFMGNALVVGLVERMGKTISLIIDKE